jgi:hypothetical protein
MARVPKMICGKFPWHAAFTAIPGFLNIFCPTSVSILWIICVCIYTHMWLRRDCIWITVATKWHRKCNILQKLGAVRRVYWVFVTGCRPVGDWANTWQLTECFIIFAKREIVKTPFTSKLSSLLYCARRHLLEICNNCTIHYHSYNM